jgi:polysaccharide deacetylase family protein (PEP-CTERM system associated)
VEVSHAMVIRHGLSFDVEHWYDGNLHREWTGRFHPDGRLPQEVDQVLDLLAQFSVTATFFILGQAAVDHPEVVRRIATAGHEVGCHAYDHRMLCEVTPDVYRAGVAKCRALLQDLTGQPVRGHRAPSWSLDRRVPWAIDVLLEAGFGYDSSIFPARTPLYGEPAAPIGPHWLSAPSGARILELPPAVLRAGPLALPYGGGAYWRLLPLWLIKLLLRRGRAPRVTYLHPWELNPVPAPVPADLPWFPRSVMHWGVQTAQGKLHGLLSAFSFVPMDQLIPDLEGRGPLPTYTLTG